MDDNEALRPLWAFYEGSEVEMSLKPNLLPEYKWNNWFTTGSASHSEELWPLATTDLHLS